MDKLFIHDSFSPSTSCSCLGCCKNSNNYNDDSKIESASSLPHAFIPDGSNPNGNPYGNALFPMETTNRFLQANFIAPTTQFDTANNTANIEAPTPERNFSSRGQPSRGSKKSRARKDKIYTDELNQSIIDTRREYDESIPKDYKFPKKQCKDNEDMTKKGFLLNVRKWIRTSKQELKKFGEIKRLIQYQLEKSQQENKELIRKIKELQRTIQ